MCLCTTYFLNEGRINAERTFMALRNIDITNMIDGITQEQ